MTPFHADPWLAVYQGDAATVLQELPERSVHCVVTSPPYWGLRDYGTAAWQGGDGECDHRAENGSGRPGRETPGGRGGSFPHDETPFRSTCRICGARRIDSQLGLEPTPEEYVANMVAVFREVRRVLRDDGTVWLNLGDSYNAGRNGGWAGGKGSLNEGRDLDAIYQGRSGPNVPGLKPKDLVGMPWRLAFALQADGWYLRSDIVWSKPNPMPESITDRPTKSHEYVFLLAKSARYYYDAEAVREPPTRPEKTPTGRENAWGIESRRAREREEIAGRGRGYHVAYNNPAGRNLRSVWTIDYNEPEWIARLGFCRRCGGLTLAGSGSEPMTAKATGASRQPTASGPTNSEPIGSPTKSLWDQSESVSPSTISVETEDASDPTTLKPSRSESTSSGETLQPLATSPNGFVPKATNTLLRTLTDALTASGNAVNACECEDGGNSLGSVWEIATAPYKGAHFATFPPRLVEPCIKAGTSEKGVCAECGAPWVRETKRSVAFMSGSGKAGKPPSGKNGRDYEQAISGTYDVRMGPSVRFETTGWRPSCAHDAATVPAVVLDCFAGTGTVGLVAQRLSRRAILIDLSMEYMGQLLRRNHAVPLGL